MSAPQSDGHCSGANRVERRLLLAVLTVVLAQGLARVAIVPLWRHYDEPAHYEYLRFMLEHGRLPRLGDADPTILGRIAATDKAIVLCQDLARPGVPDSCLRGGNAFIQPPGYYLLQAAVHRVGRPRTVAGEVMLARLVSVALSVGVAWLAFLIAKVVRPADTELALAVAALLGAIPGYVDLMSAFNNDVGAVAGLSVLVFAAVNLIRRGIRVGPVVGLVAAAAVCVELKSTAAIGVPLAAVALWLGAWPRLSPWLRWAVPALAVTAGTLLAADLGMARPMALLWPVPGRSARPDRNALGPLRLFRERGRKAHSGYSGRRSLRRAASRCAAESRPWAPGYALRIELNSFPCQS